MEYLALKNTHITLAISSVFLFVIRAGASISASVVPSKMYRVTTHLIDTALLSAGVMLAYMLSINPLDTPWLAAKLCAVAAYIVFGTVVMKSKRRRIKQLAMALSVTLMVYIFAVATSKDPMAMILP